MTTEKIKTKSLELAAFYTAKANGKTLQYLTVVTEVWADCDESAAPSLTSDLSRWRVKPEPRRMWETSFPSIYSRNGNKGTYSKEQAEEWKRQGLVVTEWQEVLP